jgi:hypothetical protein
VDLIAGGKVSVKELITGKVEFKDAEQAFKDVKAGKGIKILIEGVRIRFTLLCSEHRVLNQEISNNARDVVSLGGCIHLYVSVLAAFFQISTKGLQPQK